MRKKYLLISLVTIGFATLFLSSCGSDDEDIPIDTRTEEGRNVVAVDLGLPSGTKWADRNVGASSPSGYGDYYAWGETTLRTDFMNSNNYKFYDNGYTKYCTIAKYGKDGFVDNKTELELEDDVAHIRWGGAWRIPSREQIREFLMNTTSEWISLNGIPGRRFTASNGNSIFIPASGYKWGSNEVNFLGEVGRYWSRTLGDTMEENNPSYALELTFNPVLEGGSADPRNVCAIPVRPILQQEK